MDKILLKRMSEYINERAWNHDEVVTLNNIFDGLKYCIPEQYECYGGGDELCVKEQPKTWHIGRIIYFINHPEEIKDIQINNIVDDNYIFPAPVIEDGNHRYMAALYLHKLGSMETINCIYVGRVDLLEYLTGESDCKPED